MEVQNELYRRELLKGSTETLLLSLLATEPMYGYQLVKEMDNRSSGYFRFKEGTLYPALHRLERDEMVEGKWQDSPAVRLAGTTTLPAWAALGSSPCFRSGAGSRRRSTWLLSPKITRRGVLGSK